MLIDAAACCFGGAFLLYLWNRSSRSQAQTLTRAIHVKELNDLGELLLGNKYRPSLLVAVSGKVGSTAAFKCNRSGVLGVSLTEKAKLVFLTRNDEAGYSKLVSEEIALSRKSVPWFLEDESGRVNVFGFYGTFKRNVFAEPVNELFQRVLHLKGVKIVRHTCSEDVLEIGTPLTIVGEASRDRDGVPKIRASPSLVFNGYINIDEEVSNLKSSSDWYGDLSFFLATTGVILLTARVLIIRLDVKE